MNQQRLAGALWIAAGICCAGLAAVIFSENLGDMGALLRDPYVPGLVLFGAIAGLFIGARLLTRPGSGIVRASTAAGVVWLLTWGWLAIKAITTAGETGPKISSTLITILGVAAALVAALAQARRAAGTAPADTTA